MAHKDHNKISPLTTVYFVVIVSILVLSLLSKSFTATKPPAEMHAQKQNPLPQQTLNQGGHNSTVLSFSQVSSTETPIITKVGDTVQLELKVDPGENLVSFVKLEIIYDPKILTPIKHNAFQPEGTLTSLLDGPNYKPKGKISVTMSIGADPTKALSKPTTTATISFKAIAPTETPTLVTFGPATSVLSLASQDNASQNVLSGTQPAVIMVQGN
jgi:hypothetical protein